MVGNHHFHPFIHGCCLGFLGIPLLGSRLKHAHETAVHLTPSTKWLPVVAANAWIANPNSRCPRSSPTPGGTRWVYVFVWEWEKFMGKLKGTITWKKINQPSKVLDIKLRVYINPYVIHFHILSYELWMKWLVGENAITKCGCSPIGFAAFEYGLWGFGFGSSPIRYEGSMNHFKVEGNSLLP